MRKDPVSPELAQAILNRDLGEMRRAGITTRPTCVAPIIDPSQLGMCWGRSTLDHIQDGYGRMSKRATSDEAHLVSVCEGHSESGARAGYQWNTSHRPALRSYLAYAVLGAPDDD